MLAVGRIDAGGYVVPLQLGELTRLTQALRETCPKQFAVTEAEIVAWHRREAADSEAETNLTAALFHIDRALERRPGDLDLLRERRELAAAQANSNNPAVPPANGLHRIPARDPAATPQQIDLSAHYNLGLRESVDGLEGNDLAELLPGVQTLAGVHFDVRGIVRLGQKDGPSPSPESIRDIRVGQRCRWLHFLQATPSNSELGTQVGSYILHFADGHREELPIVYGQDLANWWFYGLPWELRELKGRRHALVAWAGDNCPARRKLDASICLWKSTRENPHPDVEVVSIDFVSASKGTAPFLVGLTVE
jgi:hypothetical protein